MKKSELRQIIREEILKEMKINRPGSILDNDDEFIKAMKTYQFKLGLEKNMFLTKDGHGNEVRILKYENKILKGLVYESRFGPFGTYEWSYGSWDQNGKNEAGYATMADIPKSAAQNAIKQLT